MKEFFIISNIYRRMNTALKNKLKQHNIPLNETQINILFLMYVKEKDMNSDELLKIGNFALSNLLFNINNLQNNSLLNSEDFITQHNLKDNNINISQDGKALLEKVDKLCDSLYKNNNHHFYEQLLSCEKEINNNIKK